jgi:hypothetical protein
MPLRTHRYVGGERNFAAAPKSSPPDECKEVEFVENFDGDRKLALLRMSATASFTVASTNLRSGDVSTTTSNPQSLLHHTIPQQSLVLWQDTSEASHSCVEILHRALGASSGIRTAENSKVSDNTYRVKTAIEHTVQFDIPD